MTPPDAILFTANSPGEIAGWLRPLVQEARRRWPRARVGVVLLPCTFASGSEGRVASELVGVDEVIPASRYLDLLLHRGRRYGRAVLFHLGGDLMYSAILAWRWGFPAWSYLWGRWWWDSAFRGYFVKDSRGLEWLRRRRIPLSKAHVVGDLVADAVQAALEETPPAKGRPGRKVSFLPGSRFHEVQGLVPLYLETAERLQSTRPDLRFQILLSPFLDRTRERELLEAPPLARVGGARGRVDGDSLVTSSGLRVGLVWEGNLSALAGSELAVTIPGTKTAEAGCLGVPQLVILPLNEPEKLPFIGLIGLLDWVPGGARLKGRLLLRMKEKIGLMAQPNLLAGRRVVPEIVEVLTSERLADEAGRLLDRPDDLRNTSSCLRDLYAPSRGTAERIFKVVEGEACPIT